MATTEIHTLNRKKLNMKSVPNHVLPQAVAKLIDKVDTVHLTTCERISFNRPVRLDLLVAELKCGKTYVRGLDFNS